MNEVLEVNDLVLESHAGRILDLVDITVCEDEIVALVGENGSGKTMTLRSIAGLEPGVEGRVALLGTDVSGLAADRRVRMGISYCPSESNVFPKMSVEENLATGKHLFPDRVREGINRGYEYFPSLERLQRQRASSLSGGEQQTLALARAMMTEPTVLLLDEFSLGLAENSLTRFVEALRRLSEEGVAVLFVDQNLRLAADLSSRDYYMYDGRVVEENVLR
ncbi:ATP-binding cassette domain-containing protein [Candidatus Bipolaricaulota bacterium]|nr:ATP-binding cassette domain-containing protein [Candidatus Bipolaricaulota bacterium]